MTHIWALARRELQAYFASPVAYVVIAFFLFLFGLFFYGWLEGFVTARPAPGDVLNVNQDVIRWVFLDAAIIMLFLLPMVTMRSFSEELRSGTMELLLTSPLSDLELVLGKFLGALALYAVMLVSTLPHMFILFHYGDPEWPPIVVGYLGLFLLGAAYIAVGLAFSALTRNQIIAGFLSFGVFLSLYLVEIARGWGGILADVVPYISVGQHLEELAKGVIDTRDLVFYASFIGLGLFWTKQSIEAYRWKG